MAWRTKVGSARPVEHASRAAAEALVDELRARYRAGAPALRVVRVYDPEGGVRLVDFEVEARDAGRALRDLARVTAAKDLAVGEATARWETAIRRTVGLGHDLEQVAAAAGLPVRELRAVLRRAGAAPGNDRA